MANKIFSKDSTYIDSGSLTNSQLAEVKEGNYNIVQFNFSNEGVESTVSCPIDYVLKKLRRPPPNSPAANDYWIVPYPNKRNKRK